MQNQFTEIIQLIQSSRNKAISAVNTELINLYWKIGAFISIQVKQAHWGDNTINELATFIKSNHPEIKGFDRRGLYRMKQFYEIYSKSLIVSSLMTQLQTTENQNNKSIRTIILKLDLSNQKNCLLTKISWTHQLILISRCKTNEEREFYIRLAIKEKYSVRELERQITSGVYERSISNLQISPSLKQRHSEIANIFKDNYIFEFLDLKEPLKESDLQRALINQMKSFVLELGKEFLFVAEEYKLHVGNSDFYIDLLFYHRGLQCLIAFELKSDKFRPEYLGQLNFYLEALDRDVKKDNENPSIGLLLCKDKDNEVVEYALSRNLSPTLVAEYKMQLPNKHLLQKKLHELFKEM
ncbi:PDDEXK nuclease domain-containing protein [Cytophaga aurantiaca]|uniref:PDDEXK nuclease domain-containing protein n=1 Tax=Cytophaga aurantiaca TaxID=29530 RepID=UPI000372E2C8|nr:PDDEXK nuclease domain-containing protein [Cytophaga aurantiaca]